MTPLQGFGFICLGIAALTLAALLLTRFEG